MNLLVLIYGAVFLVNSSRDDKDSNPGDGICRTFMGFCTLRAALDEANSYPGMDTILIPNTINYIAIGSYLWIEDSVVIMGKGNRVETGGKGVFYIDDNQYARIDNLIIRSEGYGINVGKNGSLELLNSTIYTPDECVYASSGSVVRILYSQLTSLSSKAIEGRYTHRITVKYSTLKASNETVRIIRNTLAADTIYRSNLKSENDKCIYMVSNGKYTYISDNALTCSSTAIAIYNDTTNPAPLDSLWISENTISTLSSGGKGLVIEGCNYCFITDNIFQETYSSENFLEAYDSKHLYIYRNRNENDAGGGILIALYNVDSSIIRRNRFQFSTLAPNTALLGLYRGSDYNLIDYNYGKNMGWAAIAIYDSSSYNTFEWDTLVNTPGVIIRPLSSGGTYSFPIYLDTTYDGSIPTGNTFRYLLSVDSTGSYSSSIKVIGAENTTIEYSYLQVSREDARVIVLSGSDLTLRNTTIRGGATSSSIRGYGISFEYFYGEFPSASQHTDDRRPSIDAENTTFRDVAYAFRIIDMDTSYIRLDTVFDDNNNIITGNTLGRLGKYFLPVVVQTIDIYGNLNTTGIDSVVILDNDGNRERLNKRNTSQALWSQHPYSSPYVYYDTLRYFYQADIGYFDGSGNFHSRNPFTIILYGESGRNDTTSGIDILSGLPTYTDPFPTTGYPKAVDGRWLVVKVPYDPHLLPVNKEESEVLLLQIGKIEVPARRGDWVEVFLPNGRLIERLRVDGNMELPLTRGLFLVRVGREGNWRTIKAVNY